MKSKDLTDPAVMADEFAKAIIDRRELVEALEDMLVIIRENAFVKIENLVKAQHQIYGAKALLNRLKESK